MLSGLLSACCAVGDGAGEAVGKVAEYADVKKSQASEYTLLQLKQALEGSTTKVAEAPDVLVTILSVDVQDGMQVDDLFDFRLSGLKCRTRLEVRGTAAQLAAMLATGAVLGAAETVGRLTGLGTGKVGEKLADLKGSVASKAAAGQEAKSVELDVNLDLGVRRAGEEVDAAVTIGKDFLSKLDGIIPVGRATRYVQEAITRKVKEVITTWAKNKAKGKAKEYLGETGYQYAKAGVKTGRSAYGAAADAAGAVRGAAADALSPRPADEEQAAVQQQA